MRRAGKTKQNCHVGGLQHWNIKFGSSLNIGNGKKILYGKKLGEAWVGDMAATNVLVNMNPVDPALGL